IVGSCQSERRDVHRVVTGRRERCCQPGWKVLVEQEPHVAGVSGMARSRTASAANRNAASTSAASSMGNSSMISSTVMPSATIATTVATGIRRLRMIGTPSILFGSTVILSVAITLRLRLNEWPHDRVLGRPSHGGHFADRRLVKLVQ